MKEDERKEEKEKRKETVSLSEALRPPPRRDPRELTNPTERGGGEEELQGRMSTTVSSSFRGLGSQEQGRNPFNEYSKGVRRTRILIPGNTA